MSISTVPAASSIDPEASFPDSSTHTAAARKPASEKSRSAASTGTRSVERTLRVLKELSSRGEFGWRLSDLAEQVGLDRGTCHRILACLVKENFATRHPNDVKYYPGQMLFEMGMALPQYSGFGEAVEPLLERLCLKTGCVVSLSLRSGNEVVCVFQKRGQIELSAMILRVGTRRPLIYMVGGLAILKMLPPDEMNRIVAEILAAENPSQVARRRSAFESMRKRSDDLDYALNLGDVIKSVDAIAVGLRDENGGAFGALTLTNAQNRFSPQFIDIILAEMRSTAADIEADVVRFFGRKKA